MKVLVISNLYPPLYLGGYELKCRLHVEELRRRGHDVLVMASRWGVEATTSPDGVLRVLDFDSIAMGFPPADHPLDPVRIGRRWQQLRWAVGHRANHAATRRVIAEFGADVVYAWNLAGVSIGPVLAAQEAGISVVFRVEDYWLADLKSNLGSDGNRLKREYRAAVSGVQRLDEVDVSRMLAVSRWVRDKYLALGFPVEGALIVPGGIPEAQVLTHDQLVDPAPGTPPRIAIAGRVAHQKGVHVAVQAMGILARDPATENVSLDIIGSGDQAYLEELRRIADSLGVREKVNFLGFLDHADVLRRFSEYRSVLVPSLWEEPLAGTMAEAMSRGATVIASSQGGIPELISDGQNGLLVPAGDPEALAEAMSRVVGDEPLWRRMRDAGLETVRRGYILERLMDTVEGSLAAALDPRVLTSGRTGA